MLPADSDGKVEENNRKVCLNVLSLLGVDIISGCYNIYELGG